MTPAEARRQALVRFGGLERVKEDTRDEFRPAFFEDFVRDLRYGARALLRAPGFTAVATLTLALGIGANTAIFSVVNAVLLKPLSYHEPDRLVFVWEKNVAIGKDRDVVAPPNYLDWKAQNAVFDALGAYRFGGFALTGSGEPESVTAIFASTSLFRVLGVDALVGRTYTEEEEQKRDRVVVLRHEFWQRRFGGDRSIVGKSITLAGTPTTVVGVMPPDFRFPEGNPGDMYSPLIFAASELSVRRVHSLTVIGRLKDGVTIEAASANMTALAQGIAAADNTSNPDASVVGAHDLIVEDVRLGLLVLLGTVAFVLLIACANVANLLLVRASSRRGEMAMRSALGAGRRRLIRQLLTESVLLAMVGSAVGMAVAWSVLGLLVRLSPPDLPRVDQVSIDITVLLFVTVVALLAGIGFGVAPALQVSGANLVEATQESRVRRQRGRSALVVAEVALSLMLLAGAGLMIRSFVKLQNLDLGFASENVLTAQLFLPGESVSRSIPGNFGPVKPGVTPATVEAGGVLLAVDGNARGHARHRFGRRGVVPAAEPGRDRLRPAGDRRGQAAAPRRRRAAGGLPHRHAELLPHHAHRAEERPAVHRIRRPRRGSRRDHQRDAWRARRSPARIRSASGCCFTAGRAKSSASSLRSSITASAATHGPRWWCPTGSSNLAA